MKSASLTIVTMKSIFMRTIAGLCLMLFMAAPIALAQTSAGAGGFARLPPPPTPTPTPKPTPTPTPGPTPQAAALTIPTVTPPLLASVKTFGPVAVNLANLAIHVSVPVTSKPGRGLPFAYSLENDNLWVSPWQPSLNLGWTATGPFGWLPWDYASLESTACVNGTFVNQPGSTYTWPVIGQYRDGKGGVHAPPAILLGPCNATPPGTYPFRDGSGLNMIVTAGGTINNLSIQTPGGNIIQPFLVQTDVTEQTFIQMSGGASLTDANGNQIVVPNGTAQFVDTTGASFQVGGSLWTPQSFSYTDSNGIQQTVNIQYGTYTLQTNFGCILYKEYPATTVNLPQTVIFADGSTEQFTYEATPGFPSSVTGRIASVVLPTGAKISLAYNGINCIDGSPAGLTITTSDGTWTFQHTSPTGNSPASTTTVTDAKGSQNGSGNQMVLTFQGGVETQRQIYQGSATGTPLQTIIRCYNGNKANCATTAMTQPVTELSVLTVLPNGLTKERDTFFNTAAQISEVDEYQYSASGSSSLARKTLISYASLSSNILDRPSTITVQDGAGKQVSQTTYGYDETTAISTSGLLQHVGVSGPRGNVTSVQRWLNTTGNSLKSTSTYDDAGQILTTTDPKGNTTAYAYGCSDAYLTQVTPPATGVSQKISTSYDCNTGLMVRSTDSNGQITSFSYDSMLRPTNTNFADGGQTAISYPSATQVVEQSKIDGSRSRYVTTLVDGYGRTSRTAAANGEATPYDQQDFCYDANGLLAFKSYPYQGTGFSGTSKICSGQGDSFAYDGAGRITQVTHSDGTNIQYIYFGRTTAITDEGNGSSNVEHIAQYDGLGRIVSTCEVSNTTLMGGGGTPGDCGLDLSGTGFLTAYSYDALDNLVGVSQGTLNPRTFTYDSLSRLTSSTTPESGTTTYSYDANGNVVSRIDARKITSTYTYDALNRLLSRSYSDGTPTASFYYDTAASWGNPSVTQTNLVGRLSLATAATTLQGGIVTGGGAVFSYDPVGRVIMNNQCSPLNCGIGDAPISYAYDLNGEMLTTNSFGATWNYTYNLAGRLTSVTSNAVDATHPANLLSNAHYNAFGELIAANMGNQSPATGMLESDTYDTRGRVQSIWTQANTATGMIGGLSNSGFVYAPNGKLTSLTDAEWGQMNFSYDNLNRLTSLTDSVQAGYSTPGNYSYSYDRYGNRLQQTGSNTWNQSFDSNNHLVGWSYDGAGNLLNDGIHSYTYDAEGRMVTVDGGSGSGGTTYSYDAFGRRVGRTNGAGTHAFTYDLAGRVAVEYTSTGGLRGEIYADGRHLATYVNNLTFFNSVDRLGNDRLRWTQDGATVDSCAMGLPFGDGWSCWGNAAWKSGPIHFTGMELDSESNLDHTWFRQYSPTQGRWMSPDPLGMAATDLSNPQSLNRYAYVNNDPLNSTDSLGLLRGLFIDGFNTSDPWGGAPGFLGFNGIEACPDNNCDIFKQTFSGKFGGSFTPIASANGIIWINNLNGEEISSSAAQEVGLGLPISSASMFIQPGIPKMYCSASVIAAMTKAWQLGGNGTNHYEFGFFIKAYPGGTFQATDVEGSHQYNHNTVAWDPAAVAYGHLHPNQTGAPPTDPTDTNVADSKGVPFFTFGRGGLWQYNPNSKGKSNLIRPGTTWLQPCTK